MSGSMSEPVAIDSINIVGSDGGWNDKPGASYALVKVNLVRLPEKKTKELAISLCKVQPCHPHQLGNAFRRGF